MIEIRLSECLTSHQSQQCHRAADPRLPHRVLAIGTGPSDAVRLVETSGELGRYACLSWCWGRSLPLRTVSDNLISHKIEIPWAQLPTAFQDTISITRRLRIPYIWIDALCIVQNDKRD